MLLNNNELLCGEDARAFEQLRYDALQLCAARNFELVMPPLLEDANRMSAIPGRDLRDMALAIRDKDGDNSTYIRADLTAQTAYLDATCPLYRANKVARMCYALPVLHAKARHILSTREPWYIGAEVYGDDSPNADTDILTLTLECARLAVKQRLYIGLGHAGIYPKLFERAGLPEQVYEDLRAVIARKSMDDVQILTADARDKKHANMLRAIAELYGGADTLSKARSILKTAPSEVGAALDLLEALLKSLDATGEDVEVYIDLGDMAGFDYHTGAVFSVYAKACGEALAYGGRCDGVGKSFGRDRAAVGFSADLRLLTALARMRS